MLCPPSLPPRALPYLPPPPQVAALYDTYQRQAVLLPAGQVVPGERGEGGGERRGLVCARAQRMSLMIISKPTHPHRLGVLRACAGFLVGCDGNTTSLQHTPSPSSQPSGGGYLAALTVSGQPCVFPVPYGGRNLYGCVALDGLVSCPVQVCVCGGGVGEWGGGRRQLLV